MNTKETEQNRRIKALEEEVSHLKQLIMDLEAELHKEKYPRHPGDPPSIKVRYLKPQDVADIRNWPRKLLLTNNIGQEVIGKDRE